MHWLPRYKQRVAQFVEDTIKRPIASSFWYEITDSRSASVSWLANKIETADELGFATDVKIEDKKLVFSFRKKLPKFGP